MCACDCALHACNNTEFIFAMCNYCLFTVVLQMGILDRLFAIMSMPQCEHSVMVLCLRVLIALARGGPSSAFDMVRQSTTIRFVCDTFLLPSTDAAPPASVCITLAIRILRWLCIASRNAAEALCSAGYINLTKRFLVSDRADAAFAEVRHVSMFVMCLC